MTEKMILEKIEELSHFPEYVRIIKDKSTGKSKGIALIRFRSTEDSTLFLGSHPVIEINDVSLWLEFGFEHSEDDWTCKYCHNINFQNRENCFKCLRPKLVTPAKEINDGRDDISVNPTRFLLMRNLDEHLSAQRIFEKISTFESNLKHIWLIIDRKTKISRKFAFMEFLTIQAAENFINRQNSIGVPLKIETNEIDLTFGRDLTLLSQSLSNAINVKIIYWDNNYEFSEYPPYIIIVPEVSKTDNSQILGIPAKRGIVGAFPIMSHSATSKKIQIQLKNWTEKAKITEVLESGNHINFVAENSVCKIKNRFIDATFLCCLLCDLKFSSETELFNHAQNSIEHAEKFGDYWKQSVDEDYIDYRDRAAERRDAFIVNEDEINKKIQESQSPKIRTHNIPESIPEPITNDYSVGAKLLKKMGWKEGSGLGKDSAGIMEPIKAKTLEQSGAGIGASRIISAEDIKAKSYNEFVRNDRKKRYNE